LAREAAGLTVKQLAKRARRHPRYIRELELHGAPYATAEKLSRILGCSIDVYLLPGRAD